MVTFLDMRFGRIKPIMEDRIVIIMSPLRAPKNTGARACFKQRIAAMKKVLSPSSVAIIIAQLLKKPLTKELSASSSLSRCIVKAVGNSGFTFVLNSARSMAPFRFVSASSNVRARVEARRRVKRKRDGGGIIRA